MISLRSVGTLRYFLKFKSEGILFLFLITNCSSLMIFYVGDNQASGNDNRLCFSKHTTSFYFSNGNR